MLIPVKKYTDDALYQTLPFYGIADEAERRAVIDTGEIHKLAQVLQHCNWSSLAKMMADYDSAHEGYDTYKR